MFLYTLADRLKDEETTNIVMGRILATKEIELKFPMLSFAWGHWYQDIPAESPLLQLVCDEILSTNAFGSEGISPGQAHRQLLVDFLQRDASIKKMCQDPNTTI